MAESKSEPVTMAQTHMQGPTDVGSHGPVSKEKIAEIEKKLEDIIKANPEIRLPRKLSLT